MNTLNELAALVVFSIVVLFFILAAFLNIPSKTIDLFDISMS